MWLRRYSCHDFRPKAGVRNEFPSSVVLFFFSFRPPRPALFSPASASASDQPGASEDYFSLAGREPRSGNGAYASTHYPQPGPNNQGANTIHIEANKPSSKAPSISRSNLSQHLNSISLSPILSPFSFPSLFLSFPFPSLPLLIFLISRLLSLLPGALPRPQFGALAHYPRLSRGSRCGARAPPYNP